MSGETFVPGGTWIARARRYFAGPLWGRRKPPPAEQEGASGETIFQRQARQFTTAQTITHCFYAFALYYAVTQCGDFAGFLRRINFTPLWPLTWMEWMPAGSRTPGIAGVEGFYLVSSVLGAFFSAWRPARALVFLGMLEFFALRNSFGKIGHSTHLFVTVGGLLVLLPADWQRPAACVSRRTRQETLLVFWLCQAAMMLSYSMSGVGKLGCALYQAASGQSSAFSPGALGAHVAQRLVQTNTDSVLGAFIIEHPYLTWPLMPFPIYLELFAFWIAFRPAVQRWWALALILFHVGTIFTLTITFPVNCLLLALFFFHSPFLPAAVGWREVVRRVPLLGELLNVPSVARWLGEVGKEAVPSPPTLSLPSPLSGEGRAGRL